MIQKVNDTDFERFSAVAANLPENYNVGKATLTFPLKDGVQDALHPIFLDYVVTSKTSDESAVQVPLLDLINDLDMARALDRLLTGLEITPEEVILSSSVSTYAMALNETLMSFIAKSDKLTSNEGLLGLVKKLGIKLKEDGSFQPLSVILAFQSKSMREDIRNRAFAMMDVEFPSMEAKYLASLGKLFSSGDREGVLLHLLGMSGYTKRHYVGVKSFDIGFLQNFPGITGLLQDSYSLVGGPKADKVRKLNKTNNSNPFFNKAA